MSYTHKPTANNIKVKLKMTFLLQIKLAYFTDFSYTLPCRAIGYGTRSGME